MGYLRKNSFMIFCDPDAPAEVETLDPQKIAEIETAHEQAKKGRLEDLILQAATGEPARELRLREVVENVEKAGASESALKEYIRTTFRSTNEKDWRDFAWLAHEIVISKAALPDISYTPNRTSENTVRFREDGYLGVNIQPEGTAMVGNKLELDGSKRATLWVKVVDGWSKDGNWGGYLQISCVTQQDKYIDSSSGWVKPVASKEAQVTFYDMGNYYEIWQRDRELGRPLTVQDSCLRFTKGATPAKWNIVNSTWD